MAWIVTSTFVLLLRLSACVGNPEVVACDGLFEGTPPENQAAVPSIDEHATALDALDIEALKADMMELMTDSKECWPADYGSYGPFFVRLAWHCSGSYRESDGKGGCGGGRQRFEPERSWPDNTNLDKARALLYPLKKKYGNQLSWGDLFITAGTMALRSVGAPISQLCFGRIDEANGTESLALGPSPEQERVAPCKINGQCQKPLGSTTVGLIYLNPEGPVMEDGGKPNPNPALSAKDVRDSFLRMNHSDRATVALIGGGHAIGKTHGACPEGAGPAPNEAYNMTPRSIPWPGRCGTGKGKDAFTAGFEGPWTTKPLQWDNEYFKFLIHHQWEKHIGPGGHWQWRIKDAPEHLAGLMRLTSDVALLHDEKYLKIVKEFATDMSAFNQAFDDAWYRLTVANGAQWSTASKCENGPFPTEIRSVPKMLNNDILVV